uniref:Murine leukemia virus integrase C-terminal domain-containing protein n=1 Tax=Strix occidentalis caurina TaxID=311401 RepID=A0A8D0KYH5_STROC
MHRIQPGDKVLIKSWKESSLTPRWEGPYVVLITTETAVRTAEKGVLLITHMPQAWAGLNHQPHQPFEWTLTIEGGNQKQIQTIITSGAPSFTSPLCTLIPVIPCIQDTGFYICPSSNPGRNYCSYPDHYYCGHWGCETIASDWEPQIKDKFLKSGWVPCPKRNKKRAVARGNRVGVSALPEHCTDIYLNVTNPRDPSWLVGKSWGIRLYESGRDRGSFIQIKKKPVPNDPIQVGPNLILTDELTKRIEEITTTIPKINNRQIPKMNSNLITQIPN